MLRILLTVALLQVLSGFAFAQVREGVVPMWQLPGDPDGRTSELRILVPVASDYTYEIVSSPPAGTGRLARMFMRRQPSPNITIERVRFFRSASPSMPFTHHLHQVQVSGLQAGWHHELVVRNNGVEIDRREISAEGDQSAHRLVVSSCMADDANNLAAAQATWRRVSSALASNDAYGLAVIGDVVYVDNRSRGAPPVVVTDDLIIERFIQAALFHDIYFSKRLPRFLAARDDHDLGLNDADRTFLLASTSDRVFSAFYGWRSNGANTFRGPGVAQAMVRDGQLIVMMDPRRFRIPSEDATSRTDPFAYYGQDQAEWLDRILAANPLPVKFMSSGPITGPYGERDSMRLSYPAAFSWLEQRLGRHGQPILLFTGDSHFGERRAISNSLFGGLVAEEITSGPLTSAPRRIESPRNRRIFDRGGQRTAVTERFEGYGFALVDTSGANFSPSAVRLDYDARNMPPEPASLNVLDADFAGLVAVPNRSVRVGVFHGTFDPIQTGQISLIQSALQSGLVDAVVVVASDRVGYRPNPSTLGVRMTLVERAVRGLGDPRIMYVDQASAELRGAQGDLLVRVLSAVVSIAQGQGQSVEFLGMIGSTVAIDASRGAYGGEVMQPGADQMMAKWLVSLIADDLAPEVPQSLLNVPVVTYLAPDGGVVTDDIRDRYRRAGLRARAMSADQFNVPEAVHRYILDRELFGTGCESAYTVLGT